MTKIEPIIGVVGGMGPYAGVDLVTKILDQTRASVDQEHLPVILASLPGWIPDRSTYLSGRESVNPAGPMTKILHQLEKVGVRVAGMPCVTAHSPAIFDTLQYNLHQSGSPIRLLSMLWETVSFIQTAYPATQKIGAISTTATFSRRLFFDPLLDAGYTVVLQDEIVQEQLVNPAIFDPDYGIKAQGNPVTKRARRNLEEAIDHLKEKGAQVVILGCTELPLALPEREWHGVILVDPTLALARALVRTVDPNRLKPLLINVPRTINNWL